jgi:hypothetical protein
MPEADLPENAPNALRWAVWAIAAAIGLGVGGFAASSAIEGKANMAAAEAVKPVEARISALEGANGLGAINSKLDALTTTVNSVQSDVRVLGQRLDDSEGKK